MNIKLEGLLNYCQRKVHNLFLFFFLVESYGKHPRIPWPGEAVAEICGRTFSGSKTSCPNWESIVQHFLVAGGKKTGLG